MSAYTHSSSFFESSRDGLKLFKQQWIPSQVKRHLVIQHGIGEHSGRYGNILEALEGTGTAVYGIDSRGHGQSDGPRGHTDQFQLYIDDLADMILAIRQANNMEKVYLLGHSLGGVIALQYATQHHQTNLHGLIVSSAGIYPVMDPAKHVKKFIGEGLAALFPKTLVDTGLELKYLSHDQSVIDAYQADPLNHGKISFQMGSNFFKVGPAILSKAGDLQLPILIFHGTGDGIVDVRSSRELYDRLTCPDKTLNIYEGLYHETMNETKEDRDKVLADVKGWLLAH